MRENGREINGKTDKMIERERGQEERMTWGKENMMRRSSNNGERVRGRNREKERGSEAQRKRMRDRDKQLKEKGKGGGRERQG